MDTSFLRLCLKFIFFSVSLSILRFSFDSFAITLHAFFSNEIPCDGHENQRKNFQPEKETDENVTEEVCIVYLLMKTVKEKGIRFKSCNPVSEGNALQELGEC